MKDERLKLLVIDDDDLVIQSIRICLPEQWSLTGVYSLKEVKDFEFNAAFIDLHLSGDLEKTEGLKAIENLHKNNPHLEIVAISGDLNRALMESCLKSGATRFLAKPLTKDEIHLVLEKIEAYHLLREASLRSKNRSSFWIGSSSSSNQLRKTIATLKGESGPILIEAESGCGKEVAARLIYEQEGDSRPLISVNIASIPENLFESELFGHVRGAFTGADQNKMGLAEAAHGGDLFIDEIEALPLTQQPKLLRFLENGELRRVGARDSIRVNVRVVAATNQNLQKLVKEGKFREDLFFRLNGKKILIPPLRDRKEDIPDLCKHFVHLERPKRNKTLGDDALEELQKHSWPGNVRELKRVCEQLTLLSPLPIIRAEDVKQVLFPQIAMSQDSFSSIDLSKDLNTLLVEFETQVIKLILKQEADIDLAAKKLGISRSSLYKKISDYSIKLERT